MKTFQTAFINTEEKPLRVSDPLGYFVVKYYDERCEKLELRVLREYYYKHPEAPEDAMVKVLRSESVLQQVKQNDKEYPALFLLLQAQNNIKDFCKEKDGEK